MKLLSSVVSLALIACRRRAAHGAAGGSRRRIARRRRAIPADARPPKGMCRVWIDGVPAAQQPAATDCPTAVKNRPANARVLFGDDFADSAKTKTGDKPKLPPNIKGFTGVKPARRRFCRSDHRDSKSRVEGRDARDAIRHPERLLCARPSTLDPAAFTLLGASQRPRSVPPRPRRVRRRRAADRTRHRHRADARGVRDDRARRRTPHRDVSRARLRRASARARARRGAASGSSPAPARARRSRSGRSPRRSSRTTTLKVGVVNREREATPETPSWNVIIVTTGIARRWFEEGDILATDTIVVDEIHQTSAELELCLALGKRVGCRYVWLSATVNPAVLRALPRLGRRARGLRLRSEEGRAT